jgi:endonuclease YncB( thermonuclease family)
MRLTRRVGLAFALLAVPPRPASRALIACALFLLFLGAFPVGSAFADPLAPPEAAALTTRLLAGRVWLVHAVIMRVIDGDTVVAHLDLGWHTWRHNEHVRLTGVDTPERADPARWGEAKAFVERLLPAGIEVLLVSEELDKYGRTLGRILLSDGRDVGQELLKAGLARPYAGGKRTP